MNAAAQPGETFLYPGEWAFAGPDGRLATLLGSCVSVIIWHPRRLLGGMCHYLLPTRGRPSKTLDARYADEAMALLHTRLRAHGTQPQDYEFRLIGGGTMFASTGISPHTAPGPRNIEAGLSLAARYGFRIHAQDLGGAIHRFVRFDVASGGVHVRRSDMERPHHPTCDPSKYW
ncbi:MAG: chemotaxis protein CheD [Betaproteobacteria bacterium]|nr:chemotaxis protein CheD [Betaproteobacteria bacterium]